MTHEYTIATGGIIAAGSGAPSRHPAERDRVGRGHRPGDRHRCRRCARCPAATPPSWTSPGRPSGRPMLLHATPATGDPADLVITAPDGRVTARVIGGRFDHPDPLFGPLRPLRADGSSGSMGGNARPPGATVDLDRFPRQPLLFGPSPLQPLRRLSRAPRRAGGAVGEARGLQQRPRLRRQQGAQAGVPRRGCARAGRGHAGEHRRRPVQPHARRRRHGGPPGHEGGPRPGALGRLAGRGLRQGGQHPAVPAHGRGRAPGQRRLRHRLPAQLGAGDRVGQGSRRHAVRDPGRRVGPPAGRPRLRELGDGGRAPGARPGHLLRHHHRVLGHGLHAGGHDRGLRGPGPAAHRDRHRRVGDRAQDVGPDRAHRAIDRGPHRPGPRAPRRRDRARGRLPRRHLRHPRPGDHGRHPPRRAASRG